MSSQYLQCLCQQLNLFFIVGYNETIMKLFIVIDKAFINMILMIISNPIKKLACFDIDHEGSSTYKGDFDDKVENEKD